MAKSDAYEQSYEEFRLRELHHFEAEQALANIKNYVSNALYEYGDELDHEVILSMIPDDI